MNISPITGRPMLSTLQDKARFWARDAGTRWYIYEPGVNAPLCSVEREGADRGAAAVKFIVDALNATRAIPAEIAP